MINEICIFTITRSAWGIVEKDCQVQPYSQWFCRARGFAGILLRSMRKVSYSLCSIFCHSFLSHNWPGLFPAWVAVPVRIDPKGNSPSSQSTSWFWYGLLAASCCWYYGFQSKGKSSESDKNPRSLHVFARALRNMWYLKFYNFEQKNLFGHPLPRKPLYWFDEHRINP